LNSDILKCDLHDYLEIACLFKIEVEITLIDATQVIGLPITTTIDSDRNECLVMIINNKKRLIQTNVLDQMRAMVANQHFDIIKFN
jgi:Rho-binding antiterminator